MKKLTLKYFYIFILGISSSAFAQNYSIHFDFMSGYSESLTSSTNIFGGIQPFTVEAWYKNEGVNTGANSGYDDGANIVSSYRRSGGGDPYGNFNFGINPGDSENSGKGFADHGVITNERMDDGAWHHLAATYEPNADGSWSFRLYLDGVLNDQNTSPSEGYDHTSSNNNIRMNNHSPFAGDHMLDCSYAGMSITNGAKYTENFSPQFPLISSENTIVNLDFSEGEGSQLIDNSGNGNHFNLYGNFQWGSDVPTETEPVYGSIFVPGDFSLIQEAINSASDNDTIHVSAGVYSENLNFNGKSIILFGEDPQNTIIDGGSGNTLPAVKLWGYNYSSSTQISGFKIQNYGNDGISILDGGSPRISNCIIYGVHGTDNAGGIYIGGDGIGSSVTIERCLIYGNSTTTEEGGGIRIASNNGNSSAQIINSTITQNSPEGIKIHGGDTQVDIVNSIIYNNSENSITNQGILNISYSNLESDFSGDGLINADPMFVNPSDGDFYLQAGSPSIDSGDPNSLNDPDSTIADMGAFYYNQNQEQSTSVTFMVNMRDYEEIELENGDIYSGDLSEGLFVAGGNIGFMADSLDEQIGYQMSDDDGDLIYEVTIDLEKDFSYWYKFRIGPTDGNWFGAWEGLPQECGYGEWSDRFFNTSNESNQVEGPYCFSSCEDCETPNMSLSFDGQDDYISITDDESLTSTSVITISAWFKKVSGTGWMSLVGKGTSDVNEEYILMLKDDQVYFDVGQGGGPYLQQSTTIAPETWHHIAAVHTRSNNTSILKVYLNGEDVGGTTIGASSAPNDNSYPLTIGSRWFSSSYGLFEGQIDDVRIWNVALNGEQIQESMYDYLSGYEENLVGHWNFNDGEGTVLTDLSSNGNNGTIFGATWDSDVPQPPYFGPEWYVSENGSDDNNGSQDYPFASIQHAINSSNDGDSVFVGPGTYFENIDLSGKNVSLISLDGPESTFIDGNQNGRVIKLDNPGNYDIYNRISGFTIQNGSWDGSGAGIYAYYGNLDLENNIIKENSSDDSGGGVAIDNNNVVVMNCFIGENFSNNRGGGIYINGSSNSHINNSTITNNSSYQGGGIYMISSTGEIINSSIDNNSIGHDGAGIYIAEDSYLDINDSKLQYNSSPNNGGAILQKGHVNISGCLISNNFAGDLGAAFAIINHDGTSIDRSTIIFNNSGAVVLLEEESGSEGDSLTILNSIIRNNDSGDFYTVEGYVPVLINYSNIEGGYDGQGNFDENPEFCNPAVGNYELSNSSSSLFMGQDSSYVGFFQDPGCNEPYSNYSLRFDGENDFVELQQITNIGSVSNTVSMWVKIPVVGQDNLSEGERVGNLLGNYSSSPNSNWEVTQGKIRIWWNNGEKDINGSLDLRDDQWHHLAFVRDKENNQYLGYIDGELEVVSDGSGSDISFNTPFLLGKDYRSGSGIPFHGAIDELSIWDIALTQEEIQNQSSRALSGFEPGLVTHYNFNEGNGSSISDATGNGNLGTVNGAFWEDGAPMQVPIYPDPEIQAINVDVNGNDVFMSVDVIGDYSYVKWKLDWADSLSSYGESINFENLSPGLHYVRVALYSDSNGQITDEVLQSFYVLDGLIQYFYTDFEDLEDNGLPSGWSSYSNGQGWYVSDDPYFEFWTAEPGVGNVIISNDDAADNNGVNEDYNDGSQDYLNFPILDFTSFGGPVALEFGSYFTGQWNQSAYVTYSIDGGYSWNRLTDIRGGAQWQRQYIDLSGFENYESVILGFHSDDNGGWGSGWILDDIAIIDAYETTISLSGTIFNTEDDSFIPGALVVAVEENNIISAQTLSDSSGNYSLNILNNFNYYIHAWKDGFQDQNLFVSVSDSNNIKNIYLDPNQEAVDAIVEGTLTDWYTNAPLLEASALFAYTNDDGEMETIESITDENGYFMVQVPGEQDYDLFLYADGYWVEHDAFFLGSGENQVLSIGIPPINSAARLYGTVKDIESGDLIPYAEVQLNCDQASDWDHTGDIGTYRVFNYYLGDCDNGVLVVSADGYETSIQSVGGIDFEIGSSSDLEVTLMQGDDPDPGMLSGIVYSNIDGNPIIGANISAYNITTSQLFDTSADSGGYFSLELPGSDYSISINAEGHQEFFASIHIEQGSLVDTVFFLEEAYSNRLFGAVYDSDGSSLEGATVTANIGGYYDYSELATVTAVDGSYELTVPNGNFDLSASLTGFTIATVTDVSIENNDQEINFTLEAVEAFDGAVIGTVYFFGNLSGTATINIWNEMYSAETVTDENGSYHLDLLNGTYSIFVTANGYNSIFMPDEIVIENNIVTHDIHFTQLGFVQPPIITSITDVPDDQGRELDMVWAPGDPEDYGTYTQYSVWRKIDNLPPGTPELYHYISTTEFDESLSFYDRVVPTLRDANIDSAHMSTFIVTAHTDDPYVFFDSPPVMGASIDNLAPAVPSGVSINSTEMGESNYSVDLTWSNPIDEDFAYHNIYRSEINSDDAAFVFQTIESSYIDLVTSWGNYEYWVTAVDHNGNESDPSIIESIELAVEEELLPEEFALRQNYPNPFNPSTQIRYALPEQSKVTIVIYNMLGGKVRTLVNDYQDAGYRNILWNATNDIGAPVSAGMYIYTIQAGSFYQAKKMILLK